MANKLLWQLATHLPLRCNDDLIVLAVCLHTLPARIYTQPADLVAYVDEDGGLLRDLMRSSTTHGAEDFSVRSHTYLHLQPEPMITLLHARISRLQAIV
jgi:hypothetical protein